MWSRGFGLERMLDHHKPSLESSRNTLSAAPLRDRAPGPAFALAHRTTVLDAEAGRMLSFGGPRYSGVPNRHVGREPSALDERRPLGTVRPNAPAVKYERTDVGRFVTQDRGHLVRSRGGEGAVEGDSALCRDTSTKRPLETRAKGDGECVF